MPLSNTLSLLFLFLFLSFFFLFSFSFPSQYPNVQVRLYQEIINQIGPNCEPDIHELDSLKYLDCFLKGLVLVLVGFRLVA